MSTGRIKPVHGAGHVKVMAEDEWAHIVLVAALSFTDDTALLRKAIVPELLVRSILPPLQDLKYLGVLFFNPHSRIRIDP